MGDIKITPEDIQTAIPECRLSQAKRVALYVTARLNDSRPIDAMFATGRSTGYSAQLERWLKVFCEATGRPYRPWESRFDKPDLNSTMHIPKMPGRKARE